MCWTSKKLEILTAEDDIHVWKLVNSPKVHGVISSIYLHFNYELGTLYETEIHPKYFPHLHGGEYSCKFGFHSYGDEIEVVISNFLFLNNTQKGFEIDFFGWPDIFECSDFFAILECIIPKGSKYLVNERNEYVSEKIKPIEIVDFANRNVK